MEKTTGAPAAKPKVHPDGDRPPKRRRKNATRACDRCKERKTKCEGTQPCARCTTNKEICTYEKPYHRGSLPFVPSALSPCGPETSSPSSAARLSPNRPPSLPPELTRSRETSPDAFKHEAYFGFSSALLFSHDSEQRLFQSTPSHSSAPQFHHEFERTSAAIDSSMHGDPGPDPNNRHFWFFEPPFPKLEHSSFSLPPKSTALELAGWYFDNASPTFRILHRPTIEAGIREGLHSPTDADWIQGSPMDEGDRKRVFEDKSFCAVVMMVWALGCLYPLGVTEEEVLARLRSRSIQFFQCAREELEMEQHQIDRLATCQAKFLMCLYLLSMSSVKAAWDLFATVKNMANSLDLNRSRTYGIIDPIHQEERKRTLWAVYTLDSYLCAQLGKTLTWDDLDVTEGYPTLTDDEKITISATLLPSNEDEERSPSLIHAPIAHAKLAKITRIALRRLYGERQIENADQTMGELGRMLQHWQEHLPLFLRRGCKEQLSVIYARQCSVLQLAYAHVQILIFRPSLLSQPPLSKTTRQSQEQCLDAAFRVKNVVSNLMEQIGLSSSHWLHAYVVFCAATVLFVFAAGSPHDNRVEDIIDAAEKCCSFERAFASESRMARRYAASLESLSRQVRRRLLLEDEAVQTPGPPVPPPPIKVEEPDEHDWCKPPQAHVPGHHTPYLEQPRFMHGHKVVDMAQGFQGPPVPSQLQQYHHSPMLHGPETAYSGNYAIYGEGHGNGQNAGPVFLPNAGQGNGEDVSFQGLDSNISGGYNPLFGWPGGPVF